MISVSLSTTPSLESKGTNSFFKSKWTIVALIVSGVAGITIIALGGINLFGKVGSIGFIASITGSSALVSANIASMIWIAITNYKNQKKDLQKSLQNNGEVKYEAQRDAFRTAAKERLEGKLVPSIEFPDCQKQEFIDNAKEAFEHFCHKMPLNSPIKTFRGGVHVCVTTDKIPGVLFKKIPCSLSDMSDYVERAEKARKICTDNNLFLLCIPKCKVVDFRTDVIMEEKLDLLDDRFTVQKSCYQWAIHDHELQPYMKELLRQLNIFICLMKISDIKYDNVSLMRDGRVGLFDLDEDGAITGLVRGCANGRNGLFNMLPLEWVDEFIEIAKKHLEAESFDSLQSHLPKLLEKAKKRQERLQKIEEFYRIRKITLPTSPLIFDKRDLKTPNSRAFRFAQKTVEYLNKEIPSLNLLSMVTGREILVEMNSEDPFFKDFARGLFFSFNKTLFLDLDEIATQGLEALKAQGYIFSYKVDNAYHYFSVVC